MPLFLLVIFNGDILPPEQNTCLIVAVVIAQTFLVIYALFRNMNYYDMNAPFL